MGLWGGGGFRAWHAEVQRVSTLVWLYVEGHPSQHDDDDAGEANLYIARAGHQLVPPSHRGHSKYKTVSQQVEYLNL